LSKLHLITFLFCCAFLCACGVNQTERNSDFRIQGIDVSHHQEDVDWNTVYWIARYGSKEPTVGPSMQPTFWQYGDRGRIAGIKGNVDLNVFIGNKAAFDALRITDQEVFTINGVR